MGWKKPTKENCVVDLVIVSRESSQCTEITSWDSGEIGPRITYK